MTRTTSNRIHALAGLSSLALCSLASATTPTFDDLAPGSSWAVGDSLVSDGVAIEIMPLVLPSGSVYTAGVAKASTAGMAHGSAVELNTENCTARLDFAGSVGSQPVVQLLFGEYGGNVNLAINGDFRNVANPIDLHGTVVGGCTVHIVAGGFGSDAGRMYISGGVNQLQLGGQEFAIDMTYNEGCNIAFEDVAWAMAFPVGSMLPPESGAELTIEAFQWSSGDWTSTGWSYASAANYACGDGLELVTNNSTLTVKPAAPMRDMAWQFGEYGGNINISVNGDFRNVDDYIALDGLNVGGCIVHVTSGGYGNDCGEVWLEGDVYKLSIGGQEHTVDCFTWDDTTTPGDVDGDGDVDLDDLLAMIAAWGTNDPAADVNGDGTVDVNDLMILLASFGL